MLELVKPRIVRGWTTHDHNFQFRMSAGFAGDVTRAHPSATIEPNRMSPTNPILGFGFGCVIDAASGGVRQLAAGDSALVDIYGILVRFYPGQAAVPPAGAYGQQPLGTPVPPPANQPCDILRAGYIMVPVNGTPVRGAPVFVWVAATAAPHVQGGFEAAASAGNTIAIGGSKTTFNSGPDAYGVCEVAFNI
jgi:hypothetical protein